MDEQTQLQTTFPETAEAAFIAADAQGDVAQASTVGEQAIASTEAITPTSPAPLHCLSHLEAEFEAAWASFEGDAKKALAWLASKL